jgi:hypothetical protein
MLKFSFSLYSGYCTKTIINQKGKNFSKFTTMKKIIFGGFAAIALAAIAFTAYGDVPFNDNNDDGPVVVITCDQYCSGEAGGDCWKSLPGGGCERTGSLNDHCKC